MSQPRARENIGACRSSGDRAPDSPRELLYTTSLNLEGARKENIEGSPASKKKHSLASFGAKASSSLPRELLGMLQEMLRNQVSSLESLGGAVWFSLPGAQHAQGHSTGWW